MCGISLKCECFNLQYTVECGQCFRWEKINGKDNTYIGVIKDRVIEISQNGDTLNIRSNNMDNIEEVVIDYFDLNVDYKKIENHISKIDNNVRKAVQNTTGIRILNQDIFETLISFIISANNNIPRISKSIKDISKKYGKKVTFDNEDYYLFPTALELKEVTEEDYRKCGVGFRAKYIKNTVSDILNEKVNINKFGNLETQKVREILMTMQGVGPKVADCILLFACRRREVFPIDVWVERVMCLLYFKETNKVLKKKEILEYAKYNFGEYAGIVQQHLFHNIREKMI